MTRPPDKWDVIGVGTALAFFFAMGVILGTQL